MSSARRHLRPLAFNWGGHAIALLVSEGRCQVIDVGCRGNQQGNVGGFL